MHLPKPIYQYLFLIFFLNNGIWMNKFDTIPTLFGIMVKKKKKQIYNIILFLKKTRYPIQVPTNLIFNIILNCKFFIF